MGVGLFVFNAQKPGPIDEMQGMENAIVPPSELVKKALAIGDTSSPMPTASVTSTFAVFFIIPS